MTPNRNPPAHLAELQAWMQAAITHPGGVLAATSAEPADPTWVRPSATLSAAAQLAIYSRSYHARILGSFRVMFPGLSYALGEDLLDRFAIDYLSQNPPKSVSLGDVAALFPEHLRLTRPDRDAAPDAREGWVDFLVELATLELAVLDVADGPGLEERRPTTAADLLDFHGDRLLLTRIVPAPCLCLLTCLYPVHAYLLAVRAGDKPSIPLASRAAIAVTRVHYRVILRGLAPLHYALLTRLDGSRTLGEVMVLLGDTCPGTRALKETAMELAARGVFAEVIPPS